MNSRNKNKALTSELGRKIFLAVLSLALGFSCAKRETPAKDPDVEKVNPYYSTTDLQGAISKTSQGLGIPVYVLDSKNYESEHNYFRIISLPDCNFLVQLFSHHDLIWCLPVKYFHWPVVDFKFNHLKLFVGHFC